MQVRRNIHKTNAIPQHLPEGNYLTDRIGFWALVKEVNSKNNTVTVISDTGYEFKNIMVKSDEWVTVDKNKNYVPSERNLPPKNSRVFVLTPTYSATGAFVLCSGFSRGDENIRKLWAANDSELEDKNNCRETKTQGGWDITEEYSNGNFNVVSNDGKIKIAINTTSNVQKSQNKEVKIEAWDHKIIINADGIQLNAGNEKKIKIGNSVDTLKGLLGDLINKLNSGTVATTGSETAQTVTPGQFTDISTKLGQILE